MIFTSLSFSLSNSPAARKHIFLSASNLVQDEDIVASNGKGSPFLLGVPPLLYCSGFSRWICTGHMCLCPVLVHINKEKVTCTLEKGVNEDAFPLNNRVSIFPVLELSHSSVSWVCRKREREVNYWCWPLNFGESQTEWVIWLWEGLVVA